MDFDIPIELKYLDGRYEKFLARIRRVNTGFFRITAPVHMRPARHLTLYYEGTSIEGSVLYSNPAPDGSFNVGITTDASEVRLKREPLLPVGTKAQLTSPGAKAPIKVEVTELSRAGMVLVSPVRISLGEQVSLDFDDCVAFLEVRHCTPAKRFYQVGCVVEEVIRFPDGAGQRVTRKQGLWERVEVMFRGRKRTAAVGRALKASANQ